MPQSTVGWLQQLNAHSTALQHAIATTSFGLLWGGRLFMMCLKLVSESATAIETCQYGLASIRPKVTNQLTVARCLPQATSRFVAPAFHLLPCCKIACFGAGRPPAYGMVLADSSWYLIFCPKVPEPGLTVDMLDVQGHVFSPERVVPDCHTSRKKLRWPRLRRENVGEVLVLQLDSHGQNVAGWIKMNGSNQITWDHPSTVSWG